MFRFDEQHIEITERLKGLLAQEFLISMSLASEERTSTSGPNCSQCRSPHSGYKKTIRCAGTPSVTEGISLSVFGDSQRRVDANRRTKRQANMKRSSSGCGNWCKQLTRRTFLLSSAEIRKRGCSLRNVSFPSMTLMFQKD